MSNKKVLTTSGGCDCCGDGLGNVAVDQGNGAGRVLVRHKPGTVIGNIINAFNENGVDVYELDDLQLQGPVVSLTNNAPAVSEIGQNIALVTFNGAIAQGTYPIASRSIVPDPGGLDLTLPFTFNKTNVKRTTPGVAQSHTLTAIDNQGTTKSVVSSVAFKHAFYQGYNSLSVLNQAQIKALVNKSLNDSIIEQYGGVKTYVVPAGPATPKYIYWCGPVGTPAIVGAVLNGLALPLLDLANVAVTNIYDGAIVTSYWVKRTANLLDPGTYQITVS